MIRQSRVDISVSAGSCILGAGAVLLLPLELLLAAFLAAAFHELCHLIALLLCGVRIHRFRIGIGGAAIETAPLPPHQELLCAAAGPLGSFLCLLVIRRFPLFALCALLQGIYNLLPVFPMDGGRILYCSLMLTIPDKAERISQAVTSIICIALFSSSILLFVRTFRVPFLILGGYFLSSIGRSRKTPCKERGYWVQ